MLDCFAETILRTYGFKSTVDAESEPVSSNQYGRQNMNTFEFSIYGNRIMQREGKRERERP